MSHFHLFACLLLLGILSPVFSQTDEINISASFSSSIDLTVTNGASISFTVATMGEYTGGVASPYNYFSDFEINSSVDFKVELGSTDFADGSGNLLPAGNFGFRMMDNGVYLAGTNHLLLGGSTSPSALAVLGTSQEIVTATGSGNAGSAASNAFRIHFELGTPAARAVSGLPSLLDQNITPSVYTGVVTLTASGMP